MTPLKPDSRIDLEHRAYYLRGSRQGSLIVAASQDGHFSLIGLSGNTILARRPSPKLNAISLHPSERMLALVDGVTGTLSVQNIDGREIAQIRPPRIEDHASTSMRPGFGDCFFDESGEFLWLVASLSVDECQLSLVETKSWSITQNTILKDRFGQSSFSFHPMGKPGLVSLWITAGQDGQEIFYLKQEGLGFSSKREENLTNCTPPAFSEDGSAFLVLAEDYSIRRYAFPSMKQIAPACLFDDEDNPFAESLCYLDSQHALAGTNEGRIFLFDTTMMRVEDEIAIEGHEPRPIGEYYPILAKESGLATDITWFSRLGDVIIFVFRRDRKTGTEGWKDSLLWYSVKR